MTGPPPTDVASRLSVETAATLPAGRVLVELGSRASGLTSDEVALRAAAVGPNAVRSHHASPWSVLARQLDSPLLWLLLAAAAVSALVGEAPDAVIIGLIVAASVGLGFANEYRAERAAEAMHSGIRHEVATLRDGRAVTVAVTHLVPGDVVRLGVGAIVPADVRVLSANDLACDESILTGESAPAEKSADPVAGGTPLAELSSCLFMGTVVHEGSAEAVVVAIGGRTQFGRIAVGLGERHPRTEFQRGLVRFSGMLAKVGGVLSATIFVTNVALGRPVIDAVLFSLAVAVGITPQLLPAVVSTSLATGSRRLADKKVLVKRLVCIEDLGDIDVLFTDKTGTLTDGHLSFDRAVGPAGDASADVLVLGLVCNEATPDGDTAVGGNSLDVALWEAPGAGADLVRGFRRVAIAPFDHRRRCVSVLADHDGGRLLVTKGAPETVLERCTSVTDDALRLLEAEFGAGHRVVAIATRPAPGATAITADDEAGLTLAGFLVFLDQPKPSAAASLDRLTGLGITVKIVTGDNPRVAETVCRTLGLTSGGTLTGADLDAMDDAELSAAVAGTTIFARVSPEQKARILRAQRGAGSAVAFLGDGVNDALALHHADVGISVDSATDVAKDAADIILLDRDLDVLADGVAEGRRIFANTIKYVLMGTSSNFGNMFSVTVAAAFLPFLPMLPFQILLNNLLYDAGQMTIPTDRVDEEQLARPSHWDIGFVRRFMVRFGPISSAFDFATFAVMLWAFHASAPEFRSGWFVESLATQTLIVFVIRTRRVPFFRSRPSRPLLLSVLCVVALGTVIPASPVNDALGFAPLPAAFFAVLAAFVVAYLAAVEVAKYAFYRATSPTTAQPLQRDHEHRVHRLSARWSHHRPLPTRAGADTKTPLRSLPR
ncbi:magnesium-translocating P-type ATPase [Knoellia locipacati]|uniref:Magnesium-transporting ATPase, P-type 1 n=1 Tax=Knoellia locipacati TaxID=882824 RepID=A0A512SZJ7_9MICO|nr:magnesium-translocating P-type ATPase [Knoellia locipacati]GEQ13381.1 magnesium-translocating P-type ATPase [Knoellia locipacati]